MRCMWIAVRVQGVHASKLASSRQSIRCLIWPLGPLFPALSLLADPSSLEPGISGIVGELANDHVTEIALEIVVFG